MLPPDDARHRIIPPAMAPGRRDTEQLIDPTRPIRLSEPFLLSRLVS